jgi:hypothetical protein
VTCAPARLDPFHRLVAIEHRFDPSGGKLILSARPLRGRLDRLARSTRPVRQERQTYGVCSHQYRSIRPSRLHVHLHPHGLGLGSRRDSCGASGRRPGPLCRGNDLGSLHLPHCPRSKCGSDQGRWIGQRWLSRGRVRCIAWTRDVAQTGPNASARGFPRLLSLFHRSDNQWKIGPALAAPMGMIWPR